MRWRARRGSHRCKPNLILESLEDRTALSGWTAGALANPISSAPPDSAVISGTNSQAAASSTTTAASTAANQSPATPTNSQAAAASDATIGGGDADSSTYAANSSPDGSGLATSLQGTAIQSGANANPSVAGSYPQAGTNAVAGTNAGSSSSQTSGNDAAYYSQALVQGATNTPTSYYASESYASQEYAADRQRLAAQQAERSQEIAAFRVLRDGEQPADSAAEEKRAAPQSLAEPTAAAPIQSNGSPAATPASARPSDPERIYAPHHSVVAANWTAELVEAESATGFDARVGSGPEVIALADEGTQPAMPEQGTWLAGAASLDLDALHERVARFFAHLDEQGRRLVSWPGMASLGSWLAAGAATTAAFELARRARRATAASASGVLAWQCQRGLDDHDMRFFFGSDDS